MYHNEYTAPCPPPPCTYVANKPSIVLICFVLFLLALSWFGRFFIAQHYPGVGDSDVGMRKAARRSRRAGLRAYRIGGEARELNIVYI